MLGNTRIQSEDPLISCHQGICNVGAGSEHRLLEKMLREFEIFRGEVFGHTLCMFMV